MDRTTRKRILASALLLLLLGAPSAGGFNVRSGRITFIPSDSHRFFGSWSRRIALFPLQQSDQHKFRAPTRRLSSVSALFSSTASSGSESDPAGASSPSTTTIRSGTFRAFCDHAWAQLEQQPGLEVVSLDDEFTSRVVPAKTPQDHVVCMTARALRAKNDTTTAAPRNPIRYARMILLETVPAGGNDDTTTTTTAGIQVMNLVVFPDLESDLPVWGADFVSLPGDKHLILLDAQPMALDEDGSAADAYTSKFAKWHKDLVDGHFEWGGAMPDAVLPFVSQYALWTRFGNDAEPVKKIQGPLLQAFQEHLNVYLQLLQDKKGIVNPTQQQHPRNNQAEYIRYRVANDPAKPMLKSLFGEEWTQHMLHKVLFPAVKEEASASVAETPLNPASTPAWTGNNFFVNANADNEPTADDDDETNTVSTKVQISGLPWKASQQEIFQHFSSFGQIISCKLPVQNDGQASGIALLEYADVGAAKAAVQTDGMDYFGDGTLTIKYGHSVSKNKYTVTTRLNKPSPIFSSSRMASKQASSSDKALTTVVISGLPWRCSQQETIQHFSRCGEIMSCKLTLEDDGRATGEAAIQFAQAEGATRALDMDGSDYFGYGLLSVQLQASKTAQTTVAASTQPGLPLIEPPTIVDEADASPLAPLAPLAEVGFSPPNEITSDAGGNSTTFTGMDATEEGATESNAGESKQSANKEVENAYDVVSQWDEIYKALEGDKQELIDLRSRLETLEEENQALRGELGPTAEVVSQWEEKYNKMTKDRDALSSKIYSLTKENENLRQELESKLEAVSLSDVKSKEIEDDREKLNARVKALEDDNDNLQKLLATANETISLSDQKFREMETDQKSVNAELEVTRKENSELQTKVTLASSASDAFDGKYKMLESEKESFAERSAQLEKEIAELKANSTLSSEVMSESSDKIKLLEYNQTKLQELIDSMGKENSELKKELASASEVASNEFQKSIGLEEARRKLQKRLETLEKESTVMKRELESSKSLVSQSDEDVKDLFAERKAILAQLDQLESENVDLKGKLDLANEDVSQWKSKYESLDLGREDTSNIASMEKETSFGSDFSVTMELADPPQSSMPVESGPGPVDENSSYDSERLNEEMESRIKYLEEKIAQEERAMQERDTARTGGNRSPMTGARPCRLQVTGLDWKMSREDVYQYFSSFGELVSCELPLHADGRPVGKAILDFGDEESAKRAMLMSADLYGPGSLSFQYDFSPTRTEGPRPSAHPQAADTEQSRSRTSASSGNNRVPASKKILIRGLSWRTAQQDIIDYFTVFGPINSCKLQLQGDGRSSGSAVVEFGNAEAATRAMQANGQEFYGDGLLSIQYLSPSGAPVDRRAKPSASANSQADGDTAWYN